MLAVRSTISAFPRLPSDTSSTACRLSSCSSFSYSHLSLHLSLTSVRSRRSQVFVICCQSHDESSDVDDRGDDYVQASLLLSETIGHFRGLKYGFAEEVSWQGAPYNLDRFSLPLNETRRSISAIGQGILRRFQNPTVFLKISCDGDFLLPIAVEEHAIERLADDSWEAKDGEYPNQFQFVKTLLLRLGYEVDMVRITKRVSSTYFAKVCLNKPGESTSISVDIRPSDAINIAQRCMAPIYVSKHIVTADAIQISYGMIRMHATKSVYDVTLDSPTDGPDMLVKELNLVKNMKLAVSEERYNDAAIVRDQLIELRKPQ